MPTIDPHIRFNLRLRAEHKLEDKVIDDLLDLTPDTHPTKPFEFKNCIFEVSPKLQEDPLHGHPTLIFDHCTFKKPLTLTKVKFYRDVIFRSCRFERYVDFTHSCFFTV